MHRRKLALVLFGLCALTAIRHHRVGRTAPRRPPDNPVVADNVPSWLRYPAISPDGKTIVFAYKGDLYRVPSDGGVAVPLTMHEAHDYHARLEPRRQVHRLRQRPLRQLRRLRHARDAAARPGA